ncbi:hypothetical protein J6590_103639 [Homalodisca vitripennis]|nr:hypothetical protein J6590_103639 [Homalodisca vitripennis]
MLETRLHHVLQPSSPADSEVDERKYQRRRTPRLGPRSPGGSPGRNLFSSKQIKLTKWIRRNLRRSASGSVRRLHLPQDERGAVIRGLRKTRASNLLVDLRKATRRKSAFSDDRQSTWMLMRQSVSKANSLLLKVPEVRQNFYPRATSVLGGAGVAYVKSSTASRSFKRLGFGHAVNRCNGSDGRSICYKFGGQYHKVSTCTAMGNHLHSLP